MSTRVLYLYDEITREYLGSITQGDSPLEPGVFFYINNSTEIAPPKVIEKQVPVFVDGAWSILEDFRGHTWYDELGNSVVINELGVPAEGLSKNPPLEVLKTGKKIEVKEACGTDISGGFNSLMGFYPCSLEDQNNVLRVAILGGNLWCKDFDNNWCFVYHDEKQARKVLSDMNSHIQSCQSLYANLLVKIGGATSSEELKLV